MATVTFEDLIRSGDLEIGDGYRAKNSELGGSGLIFLRSGHLTDTGFDFENVDRFREEVVGSFNGKVAKAGDTVVTTKGNSTGRVGFVERDFPPFVYSPHLSFWRSSGKAVASDFLRYWSRGDEFHEQLEAMKTSTDMAPYLSLTDQRRLRITLPESKVQAAIGATLTALDDKIASNRKTNQLLQLLAASVFQSWMIDFDPVAAKRDGRRPVGVPSDVIDLFPSHFEESNLGPIPRGWRIETLSELAEINARTLSAKTLPTEIRYVEISDVHRGDVHRVTMYARGKEPSRARRAIRHGDTVLSAVRPERGAYFLCLDPPKDLVASTGFVVLSPRATEWALVYCAATCDDAVDYYERHAEGGAYPAMRPDAVAAFKVALPDRPELREAFSQVANPLLLQAQANREQVKTLAELRDALLGPLLSGELAIKAAEKAVGAAV